MCESAFRQLVPEDAGSKIHGNVGESTYPTTQLSIPEDPNLQQHRCENLKHHILVYLVKSA
jgi:hypothetical protein